MRNRLGRWGPALLLTAYFFWFAGSGLWAPFTGDDLMNLNVHLAPGAGKLLASNVAYWSPAYRPMGGVFYGVVYGLAGFHPLPFRVACFGLLLANLWLLYRVCFRLTGWREAALLATALACYHAWMVNLYFSTGTVYDLLCFAFYFGALDYYLRIRESRAIPNGRQTVVLLALYVCALNSKEMAVTLPLSLIVYEWSWHRKEPNRLTAMRVALVAAAMTVPYVIGKLTGAGGLTTDPAYRPQISALRYLKTYQLYLNILFYQDHFFRSASTVALLALMLGLALWSRSRPLLFAWCFVLFSVLPFIFIPHYSGFFLYLPMAGWALYGGTALAMLRESALKPLPAPVWLVVITLALAPLHARESRKTLALFRSFDLPTREVSAELQRVHPTLPTGARLYFRSDPFPAHNLWLGFLARLVYHDFNIEVLRAKDGEAPAGRFDGVLEWSGGRLMDVSDR